MPVYAYQTKMSATTPAPFLDRPDLLAEVDIQVQAWMNQGLTDGVKSRTPRPDSGEGMQVYVTRNWTTTQAAQAYIDFVDAITTANALPAYDIHEIVPIA